MICPNCKSEITTGGAFCPYCGTRLSQEGAAEKVTWVEPKKKKNKGLLIGLIGGAAVLVCAVLAILLLSGRAKKPSLAGDTTTQPVVDTDPKGAFSSLLEKKEKEEKEQEQKAAQVDPAQEYAAALDLLEQGEYARAQEALSQLGGYEDAEKLIDYAAARLLLEEEKFAQAREAFAALGDFRDAPELTAQCQNEVTYAEAVAKKEAGDYAAAAELFASIPGVKDADELKGECYIQITNAQIAAAIASKDWETALELLDGADGQSYPDHASVRQDCYNRANYDKAKQAMEDKKYYTAYTLFSEMGNYQDAANLASMCQRPTPETGQLSRNSDYKRQTVRLNLKNELKGGYNIYVRIYDSSGSVFVSSVFIRNGKGAVIYLPDDSYLMKAAYGKGQWFGEYEMFGDDAIYKELFTFSLEQVGRHGYFYYTFTDELNGTTTTREEF